MSSFLVARVIACSWLCQIRKKIALSVDTKRFFAWGDQVLYVLSNRRQS
jgi:hypothetical protein